MVRRSYVDWGTSVRLDRASALLVFNGGNCIYGLWEPMGTPTLVKIHGDYDIAGISVTELHHQRALKSLQKNPRA